MDEAILNNELNNYISDHFSPRLDDRTYISKKYELIKAVVGDSVFQSGSYGRFTAIYPVHDLDVIYVCKDPLLQVHPLTFMQELKRKLEVAKIKGVKNIDVQTHSVTIEFDDAVNDFGIDIVPAHELNETNEFGQPLYLVPEILTMNHSKRAERYVNAATKPIGWVRTDPRGYMSIASKLNEMNANFRHTVKLVKAWRHAAKEIYKSGFKLKSFHLELIITEYFINHPDATTSEAVVESLGELGTSLTVPSISDRADSLSFVDQYVAELTVTERQLIYNLQSKAHVAAGNILAADNTDALHTAIEGLTNIKPGIVSTSASSTPIPPQQPWAG